MFKSTIVILVISTAGVILLFGGIIGLIDYIVFLDENPDYNHIVTLYLVGGALIIGLGVIYVLRENRKHQSTDKDGGILQSR